MSNGVKVPDTLMEAIQYFSDPLTCIQFFAGLRWENGEAVCPRCESKRVSFLNTRLMWKCLDCKKQFSIKVGTIFEDSPIGLDKWLCAMFLIANCKNGVSSYEIARDVKVMQRTAWFMLQRIRHAMHTGTFNKLSGQIEADESFIGGKARNMHKDKRAEKITGRGPKDKTIAMGVLERGGEVRVAVVPTRRKGDVQASFMFQPQNMIANPNVLFYKTDTIEHREKLRTIFPYVLGAVSSSVLAKRHELKQLRRELRRKQQELATVREVSERWRSETRELGLLAHTSPQLKNYTMPSHCYRTWQHHHAIDPT